MARYSISMAGVTITQPAAGGSHALDAAAITAQGGTFRVYEVHAAGEVAASAYYRFALNRPSVQGTINATSQTPEKLHPAHPAAGVVCIKPAYTVAPTFSTNDVLELGFNGYGGAMRWHAPVDGEIWVVKGVANSQLAVGSRSGVDLTVSGHILWEEF